MSERMKGRLEWFKGKLVVRLDAYPGVVVRLDGASAESVANRERAVACWNAFEEGGAVEELVKAAHRVAFGSEPITSDMYGAVRIALGRMQDEGLTSALDAAKGNK